MRLYSAESGVKLKSPSKIDSRGKDEASDCLEKSVPFATPEIGPSLSHRFAIDFKNSFDLLQANFSADVSKMDRIHPDFLATNGDYTFQRASLNAEWLAGRSHLGQQVIS